MPLATIAQGALLSFAAMAAVGVLFAWGAWWAGRRWGGRALAVGWVLGAVAATGAMVARVHHTQVALGFTPAQQQRFPLFGTFLPMWALALGAVALVVRRHLRAGAERFTPGLAGRSLGAWVIGVVVFLLAFAALDITAVI